MKTLVLSPLGHTWFLDLDGTLVKHNGHLTDGHDSLLPGADALLAQIPADDLVVIVTSRGEAHREATEQFLADSRIRYDHIIFDAPFGERIVVNDAKPSGLITAVALNGTRDEAPSLRVCVDASL
jgi:ribonucleotide monophosphatase NagD (HAD superfamily)